MCFLGHHHDGRFKKFIKKHFSFLTLQGVSREKTHIGFDYRICIHVRFAPSNVLVYVMVQFWYLCDIFNRKLDLVLHMPLN